MKNLRFTFRMLKRNPLLVFVNIPGLAIGLSAVLLLSVYLKHELSFDQWFPTKDRVLRLYSQITESSGTTVYGICLRKAYTEIPAKVPEIQSATQIYRGWNVHVNVKEEEKQFPAMELLYADPGFFDVFGLPLIAGDKKEALNGKRKVVLTRSSALKIFNKIDCAGEVVRISDEDFIVTGVVDDLPATTHFHFQLLASIETIDPEQFTGLEYYTYFLIRENANLKNAGEQIAGQYNTLMQPLAEQFNMQVEPGTELLKDIHLHTKVDFDLSPKASLANIRIVAGIAFFILLIALVNYINLYVLHGEKRIAEIASRKSLGANPGNLARMFYFETGIIGLLSFGLALLITFAAQPYFAKLMQRPLSFSELLSPSGILLVFGFLTLLIMVSGAYPTFRLSRINLVSGLRGKTEKVNRKSRLSVASVLVQFTITIFLISSLIVIHAQVSYLKNVPLGFHPEQVIRINGYRPAMRTKYQSIQDELSRLPFVESAGSSHHAMGGGCSGQGIKIYGDPGSYLSIDEYRVQPGFCTTMQMNLLDGRFFRKDEQDKGSVILNEAAVKMLGLDHPVDRRVDMFGEPMKVIGVVQNFYSTTHPGEPIGPLVLTHYAGDASGCYMRIRGAFTPDRQAQVTRILKQYDPDYILGYSRLADIYSAKFAEEDRVMRLVSTGAWLAILISFMGLMALSLMNVNRRTKEIGIRKAVGSTVAEVMVRLLRQSVILVLISCVIAFVPGYLAMREWLAGFSDKIPLSAGYFLLSGLFALLIALLAVGWQSWKAATRNPVEALRYE